MLQLQTEKTKANDHYSQFTGTDHYYKHYLGFTFTDGVGQIAEDCGAYWLIDLVASYRNHPKVRDECFQTWTLSRVKNNKFKVVCTDGNENILVTQKIPFSDFKYDECVFWCIEQVIMLPSEY